MDETIVALATASGVGSIAIVRLSGKNAYNYACNLTKKDSFAPRYATLAWLYDHEGETIDQAIVIYFKSPLSFTGEDVVEFQCHGGMIVAQAVIDTLLRCGARLAMPGEFTKRAFLNGKIDLSKAEAIAKLIDAKSVKAARLLTKQLKGELSNFVDEAKRTLIEAMAHSEVLIDYAEEDIPSDLLDTLSQKLDTVRNEMVRLVESSRRRKGVIEGFQIAIIGKPNVGKSSLLNALLAYDRAIVSDIAGTTRDTIEERIKIGSYLVRIVDTAGIREGSDTIERIGIERSMRAIEEADIVIALFDASRIWDEEDEKILALMKRYEQDKAIIAALNKSDLERKLYHEALERYRPLSVSAKKSFQVLAHRLEGVLDTFGNDEELMLVSARQIEAVERAAVSIREAQEPLQRGELEFFTYHLKEALVSLSTITEPFDNEQILDKMFSEFCLGK